MNKLIISILLLFVLQAKPQSVCDSISYEIGSGPVLNVIAINNSSTELEYMWGVCNAFNCFSASGDTAYFNQIIITDTAKVCYDAAPIWSCSTCELLIFNGVSWVPLYNITSIHEITNKHNDGKIYDLLGRELKYIPNTIYIRNNRLYK